MLRERELLSLRRRQHRFEAWLSLAQCMAGLVDAVPARNQALRKVSEALKSKLAFQEVAFFHAVGRSLSSIELDPDGECAAVPFDEGAIGAIFSAQDGQSPTSPGTTLREPTRFHRFLWHWVDAVTPSVLLVAGYDRERAEFYPPFDETDLAQFALVGRGLDLLLAGRSPKPSERGAVAMSHALTGREIEVSRLLACGKTNKEIGTLLGISSRTVQSHVANIFDKLRVRNRAGAVSLLVGRQVAN
jgi:DNA-binding CsgD family transcriptional regulator